MAYSYAQLQQYAQQAGFSPDVAGTMAAIALAESSGNADATHVNSNGSTDYGLWQINSVHGSLLAGKNWHDPLTNAQMAYAVYQGQGLKAWSTYTSGAYRKYSSGTVSGSASAGVSASGNADVGTDPFGGVTDALNNIGQSFAGISALATTVQRLALPQTWVRIMAGVFGAGLVGFGVVILAREVRG